MAGLKRILVVDDDVELSAMVMFYLAKQGYAVSKACNGLEAIETAQKERFDVIVMDVVMPEMDGYHAAQELSEKLGANCPKLILMTSRDLAKEAQIAYASGACDVIQKPLRLTTLKMKVRKALGD